VTNGRAAVAEAPAPRARSLEALRRLWRSNVWAAVAILAVFALVYFLPENTGALPGSVSESLALTRWYAREHVLLCLVPAFFIAGAIAVFVSRGSVMRYLGSRANKVLAYGVASVSGSILAVCSCTVLPLFSGIYKRGAGLGPATAFLYSGPAINVLAVILTARVLGVELGVARAVGAVVFSVVVGIAMHVIFRREEARKAGAALAVPDDPPRRLGRTALVFAVLVGILVFVNWGRPESTTGFWHGVYAARWLVTGALGLALAWILTAWFGVSRRRTAVAILPVAALAFIFPAQPQIAFAAAVAAFLVLAAGSAELREWTGASWGFAKQILPLLLVGVLVAGFLLGRPGHEGLIPSAWISGAVGGNSIGANLFASVAGAFMYFATLTEVPILQGLLGNGMGKGPALALLLAGPALSLPNMLVIRGVMGTRKTLVYVSLVVVMATVTGIAYGALFG
jgi:uncharacterized membrane protein YraQ (UPF0718 family)